MRQKHRIAEGNGRHWPPKPNPPGAWNAIPAGFAPG